MPDRYEVREIHPLAYELRDREIDSGVAWYSDRNHAVEACEQLNQKQRFGKDAIAIEQAEMEAALSRPDRFEQE